MAYFPSSIVCFSGLDSMGKKIVEEFDKTAKVKRGRKPSSFSEVKKEDFMKDYDSSAKLREKHDKYIVEYRYYLRELQQFVEEDLVSLKKTKEEMENRIWRETEKEITEKKIERKSKWIDKYINSKRKKTVGELIIVYIDTAKSITSLKQLYNDSVREYVEQTIGSNCLYPPKKAFDKAKERLKVVYEVEPNPDYINLEPINLSELEQVEEIRNEVMKEVD
jgi:hypothetical protein